MCGIFGWSFLQNAGPSKAKRAILGYSLAHENDARGGHSWGSLAVTRGGDFKVRKGLGKMGHDAHGLYEHSLVYGHTRFATTGATVVANAHPFEIGGIIGAHNGMVYNHGFINSYYDRSFEVDSMHIFAHIDEKQEFGELEGYGAIEFVRKENPFAIYLAKLRHGDLSVYGVNSDAGERVGVVWSSLEYDLQESLSAAGIRNTFEYQIEEHQMYQACDGKLYVCEEKLEFSEGYSTSKERKTYYDLTSGKTPGFSESEDWEERWQFYGKGDRGSFPFRPDGSVTSLAPIEKSNDNDLLVVNGGVSEDPKEDQSQRFGWEISEEDMQDWKKYCNNED